MNRRHQSLLPYITHAGTGLNGFRQELIQTFLNHRAKLRDFFSEIFLD
jgi:hypothetical protein